MSACLVCVFILTSSISTKTIIARWCWTKLIHVKSTAVTNTNAHRPETARRKKMKADCSIHSSVSYRGMWATQPPRPMRTASMCGYTWCGNFSPRCPAKPVPARWKIVVAFVIISKISRKVHCSIGVLQVGVVGAFCENYRKRKKKWINNIWEDNFERVCKPIDLWESEF